MAKPSCFRPGVLALVALPLRKALWVNTVREGSGARAYRTIYNYDSLGRLLRETTPDETTRYTAWDQDGHPTAGDGSTQNASSRLQLSYGELTTFITKSSNFGSVTCTQHFDQAGNQIATSCVGPGSFRSQSQTTITASTRVCK